MHHGPINVLSIIPVGSGLCINYKEKYVSTQKRKQAAEKKNTSPCPENCQRVSLLRGENRRGTRLRRGQRSLIHLPKNLPICVRWGGDDDSPLLWPVNLTQAGQEKRRADVSTIVSTSLQSNREPDLRANGWNSIAACDRDAVGPQTLVLVVICCGRFPTAGGCTRRVLVSTVSFYPRRGQRGTAWRREMFIERSGRAGVGRVALLLRVERRRMQGNLACVFIFHLSNKDVTMERPGWIQPLDQSGSALLGRLRTPIQSIRLQARTRVEFYARNKVGGCQRAARLPEKLHLDMKKIMVHIAQPSVYIPVVADGLVHKPDD